MSSPQAGIKNIHAKTISVICIFHAQLQLSLLYVCMCADVYFLLSLSLLVDLFVRPVAMVMALCRGAPISKRVAISCRKKIVQTRQNEKVSWFECILYYPSVMNDFQDSILYHLGHHSSFIKLPYGIFSGCS